jgi:hypothetical protein
MRAKTKRMQYTVRGVSVELARALTDRAKRLGKSVNEVALEALAASVARPMRRRNLRAMPGAWSKREASDFDHFLNEHRTIVGLSEVDKHAKRSALRSLRGKIHLALGTRKTRR